MAEAKLNREYALRIVLVGAMMFGMCVWSIYDGAVGWPRQNQMLEKVRPALLATNLTAEAWLERDENGASPIDAAFRAAGEKTPSKLITKIGELKVPESVENRSALRAGQAQLLQKTLGEAVYSEHDLKSQFVQAAITALFGALAWLSLAVKARRRFVADENGLHGSGFGGQIAYDDLARIDWSKWDDKGIAVLALKSGACHKMDGWHFAGMTGVVDEIKRHRPDLDEKK